MDGVLVIDKPAGVTSHDVVDEVRRILHVRRVGHTGTLDPFATGVLVILVGRATRLAQFLSGVEKEYEAVICLGYATDTGDVTGKRIENVAGELGSQVASIPYVESDQSMGQTGMSALPWGREQIEAALASLRGEIDQVPPMYSAKKQGGRKLYELARRGEVQSPIRCYDGPSAGGLAPRTLTVLHEYASGPHGSARRSRTPTLALPHTMGEGKGGGPRRTVMNDAG